MFLWVEWMVVFEPLIERTGNLTPILAASFWMIGIIRVSTARVSAIISTFLQAEALHVLPPFEYFDCFISAWAFARSPEKFGVEYGSYSASPLPYMTGGAMCVPNFSGDLAKAQA